MAFVVACPACERKLQLPEGCGGASVRCPSCLAMFTAPDSAPGAARPAAETEVVAISLEPRKEAVPAPSTPVSPGPNILREARRPWVQLRSGLTWILVGIAIELTGYCLLHVSTGLFLLGGLPPDLLFSEYPVGSCVNAFLYLIGAICTVVGLFYCCLSPIDGVRRWFVFVALGLILLLLLPHSLVRVATPWYYMMFYLSPWGLINLATGIGEYVGRLFLVLFIREVGQALRDNRTLSRFRWFVALFIIVICGSVAGWLSIAWIGFTGDPDSLFNGSERLPLLAISQLALLALLIQQIRLITAARRAVRKHISTLAPTPTDPEEDVPCSTSTRTST